MVLYAGVFNSRQAGGLIGSIRRECLDHVIVLNQIGLYRILKSDFEYYERTRTRLSLVRHAPTRERTVSRTWESVTGRPTQEDSPEHEHRVYLGTATPRRSA
jgi:hypothetical protein